MIRLKIFFSLLMHVWCHAVLLFRFSIVWKFIMESLIRQQSLQIIQLYYEKCFSCTTVDLSTGRLNCVRLCKLKTRINAENWTFQINHPLRSHGQHLNEIIFRMYMSEFVLSSNNKYCDIQIYFKCFIINHLSVRTQEPITLDTATKWLWITVSSKLTSLFGIRQLFLRNSYVLESILTRQGII